MTAAPTTTHLPAEAVTAIADLFRQGRRVSEVVAQGLATRNGWRKADVIDVLQARGWRLDSDGRIPRQHRATGIVPVGTLPGAPPPAPGAPVSWPENGTVTVDRSSIPQLIADGKAHTAARVRKLAEKADTAIKELRTAVADESGREEIRRRLADLDAERDRLRAQLGGPGRKPKATQTPAPKPATVSDKPINHGTWGGFLAETARGLDHCADCNTAKEEQMAAMRTKKALNA